jgi:hypothetical protein
MTGSTTYLREEYSLDTARDEPHAPMMASPAITPANTGLARSLDTYSGTENAPFMAQSGEESGQRWHIIPAGDCYVRLTNDFLGTSHSLDTHSGSVHEPFMGHVGQAVSPANPTGPSRESL